MSSLEKEISTCLLNTVDKLYAAEEMKENIFLEIGSAKAKQKKIHKAFYRNTLFEWKSFFRGCIEIVLVAVILIAVPVAAKYGQQENSINTNSIHPALKNDDMKKYTFTANEENSGFVTQYNISGMTSSGVKFKGQLLEIKNSKKIVVGYDDNKFMADKTTSQIAKSANAICAVNASSYMVDKTNYGIIVHDGKLLYAGGNDEDIILNIVGFNNNGVLVVGNYSKSDLKKLNIKEAVSSFMPALIINGKRQSISNKDTSLSLAPRTAIGQKADGTVLFLVIDGRSLESIGASLTDLQNILLEKGAVNASILDGGISSTMYYNGQVINHPCSADGEQNVASTFMVLP